MWTQKPDFGKVPEYLVQAQKLQTMQLADREAAETLRLQQVSGTGSEGLFVKLNSAELTCAAAR